MTSRDGWDEELHLRLHDIFMAEAAERLAALDAAVGAVENGASGDDADRHLGDAFRHAHTLKGGARAVGLPDVERLAGTLEALFEGLRGGVAAGPDTWAAASAGVDTLRRRLAGEPVDVDTAVAALTGFVTGPG